MGRNIKIYRGFTMVELMIVVAIIAILAAIALPLYSGWVIRSRLSEGILALSQCRQSISEIYQMSDAGVDPGIDGWGCGENQTETSYVSAISTDVNGVVQVELRNIDPRVDGSTIHMVPTVAGSPAVIADIPSQVSGFLCRAGGSNPVDEIYMPGSCR